MKPIFFIFGFGYTAHYLAEKLVTLGFKVVGTTGHEEKIAAIKSPITLIDFQAPNLEDYLNDATHLLISIPPLTLGDDGVLLRYSELIRRNAKHIQWIGYLSSTGVYGDHQGQWVDEKSVCKPLGATAVLRLEAEQAWLNFAKLQQLPVHIFRLAGIYGPQRNALVQIKAGKQVSIFKEGQVFSRIHVADIVAVLLASINKINPLAIYNVADDEPEASHVIDAYAASLLHQAPLPLVAINEVALSPMAQEFYANNRRVSNLKIKKELNVSLQYPSFRQGLTQIWREDFA